MKIPCEIDNVKTLKKGAKITFSIGEDNVKALLQNVSGFMDTPLTIKILTDAGKQKERLLQITPEQRKKIYALIKDICSYTGDGMDNGKENIKQAYCTEKEIEMFSLSDCKSELAGDFITWLIEWCFMNGVPLSEHPIEGLNDIENYLLMCIKYKKCCVCGKDGAKYHKSATNESICLCDVHKAERMKLGQEGFDKLYHVQAIKC